MVTSTKAVEITKSDSTDYTGVRAIYVGGAGNLAVRLTRDPATTITLIAVTVGQIYDLRVTRVMAATTATNLVGFY